MATGVQEMHPDKIPQARENNEATTAKGVFKETMRQLTLRDKVMLMALVVWFIVLCVVWAFAHDSQILKCGGYDRATKLNEEVLPNGMLKERYDTNQDGKADVNVLSAITGTDDKAIQHQPYPIFYYVDINGDDYGDYVMVDKYGEGSCESITLYADLNKEPRPDTTGKGGL